MGLTIFGYNSLNNNHKDNKNIMEMQALLIGAVLSSFGTQNLNREFLIKDILVSLSCGMLR